MSTYKIIIAGRLEFGSSRSFEQVLNLFQHRVDNYYRNATLLNSEEIFDEAAHAINVPRFIAPEATEKSWKNTINLLKYINDFAIAGHINVWVIFERKLVEQVCIEPDSDKVAVQSFLKGRELIQAEGMEEEAMKSLNRAIEKFEPLSIPFPDFHFCDSFHKHPA